MKEINLAVERERHLPGTFLGSPIINDRGNKAFLLGTRRQSQYSQRPSLA